MTKTVKVHEAKTNLSALLVEVERGADVIIARGDTPVARLTRIAPAQHRRLDFVSYDLADSFFDELPEEELAVWES